MIAIILFFLYRIILYSTMGAKTAGYYSIIADWYYVILLFSIICIPYVVRRLMRPYLDQKEYKNVQNIFRGVMSVTAVITGAVAAIVFVLSGLISNLVYGMGSIAWAFRVLAVLILTSGILGVYRGALLARMMKFAVLFSVLAEQLTVCVTALILVRIYGQGDAARTCDAMAAAMLIGGGISLLFTLVIYDSFKAKRIRAIKKDAGVAYVSEAVTIRRYILDLGPYAFCLAAELIGSAVCVLLFNLVLRLIGYTESVRAEMLGIYSGIYRLLILIPAVVVICWCMHFLETYHVDPDDQEKSIAHIRRVYKVIILLIMPFIFALYTISESIMNAFFLSSSEVGELFMYLGIPLILIQAISFATITLLLGLKLRKRTCINLLIALAVQIVTVVILMLWTNMNVYALLYSSYVFNIVAVVLNIRLLHSIYDFATQWVRMILMPLFVSIIMGVLMWIVFHLAVVITHAEGFSVVISIILAIVIYLIAAFFLDMISEEDLAILPGGAYIISFCKKVHIL